MYIVTRDGSGDFTSIQAAVDAIPVHHRQPAILLVRMNEYSERVVVHRDNLRIIGEARDRTVITSPDDGAQGCTFLVTGRNVEVENITIRGEGEAAAACAAGDRGVWRNVRFNAAKTALLCGKTDGSRPAARQYLEDCRVEGGVVWQDSSRCWFSRCTITGGISLPEATAELPFSAVMHHCRLFAGEDASVQEYPRLCRGSAALLNCGLDEENRAKAGGLTETEAALLPMRELIGGCDGWDPSKRTPTWFLCGDSTMADYAPCFFPMTGWGTALQAMADGVFVENCAVPGRSSKSFAAEKRLGFIELCLRRGDRLFIQFGHNDEKDDVERATIARVTFPAYLSLYIDAARRQGAEPVLLTPVARRSFDENGTLLSTHGEYPQAMRALAAQRGVRLLDMERATEELLREMGAEGSKALFNWLEPGHPNYPDGVQDNTHLNRNGAVRLAEIALRLMEESEA